MIGLTIEQQELAKRVHDYACRFPATEDGDAQLLQGCYDYMASFKQVLDSSSKIQMDYICQQYPVFCALQHGWNYWHRALRMGLLTFLMATKNHMPEISALKSVF